MNKEDRDGRIKELLEMEKELREERYILQNEKDEEIRQEKLKMKISFSGKCYKVIESKTYKIIDPNYKKLLAYKVLSVNQNGKPSSLVIYNNGVACTSFEPWVEVVMTAMGNSIAYNDISEEITDDEFNNIYYGVLGNLSDFLKSPD